MVFTSCPSASAVFLLLTAPRHNPTLLISRDPLPPLRSRFGTVLLVQQGPASVRELGRNRPPAGPLASFFLLGLASFVMRSQKPSFRDGFAGHRSKVMTPSKTPLFIYTDAPRCRNPQTNTLVFSSIERTIDVPCDVDASPGKDVHFSWTVKNVSATQPRPLKDFVVNGELFCVCSKRSQ